MNKLATSDNTVIAHHRESDDAVQTLEQHLLGVARMSCLYAKKLNMEDQGELIGLLHDLGKYSDGFQSYIKSAVGLLNQDEDEEFVNATNLKGKIDHSTAGAQMIWQQLSKQGQLGEIVGQVLSLCIASHHSGLIDCLSSDEKSLGEDVYARFTRPTMIDGKILFERPQDCTVRKFVRDMSAKTFTKDRNLLDVETEVARLEV